MNNSVSGNSENDQDSTAPPTMSDEKHCHCVCHLQRPGMKLVWVPLQEENNYLDTVREKRNRHQNSGRQRAELQKKEDVLHLTSNEVAKLENETSHHSKLRELPPCINCQSFLYHHSPHKLASKTCVYADDPIQNHSKPPLPPRTYQSSKYQNIKQYAQLQHTDANIYLDLLPSKDNILTTPAVPPRPLPRPPLHPTSKQKTEKWSSQPSLACVISLRGGYLPIRNISPCKTGRLSNSTGEHRRIHKYCGLLKRSTEIHFI